MSLMFVTCVRSIVFLVISSEESLVMGKDWPSVVMEIDFSAVAVSEV